jgi:DNA-binding NtrC family response regulator
MVYGIVKQSGGSIEVYSEPSHGTTVKIYLPRVDAVPEEGGRAEPRGRELARGSERILLAEDESQLKALVVNILSHHGYTVETVDDPGELETIVRQAPRCELLLTDIVMPKMNGPQVAKRVAECWPETKVLYMSGYVANAIVYQGVIDEGLPFLQKPFSPAALLAKVREVLDA